MREEQFYLKELGKRSRIGFEKWVGFNKQVQERRLFQGEKRLSGIEVVKCQRIGKKFSVFVKYSVRGKLMDIVGWVRLWDSKLKDF